MASFYTGYVSFHPKSTPFHSQFLSFLSEFMVFSFRIDIISPGFNPFTRKWQVYNLDFHILSENRGAAFWKSSSPEGPDFRGGVFLTFSPSYDWEVAFRWGESTLSSSVLLNDWPGGQGLSPGPDNASLMLHRVATECAEAVKTSQGGPASSAISLPGDFCTHKTQT